VMERDSKLMRQEKPFIFTNLKTKEGIPSIIEFIELHLRPKDT
jgi:urease accessory protein